jgi:hypothetical protein
MIPPGNFPPHRPGIPENVNEAIRVREVRAVFPDGSVEIMPTPAAVRKAQEMGLDLILIAPTAEPPVAKAMDYVQWQYEEPCISRLDHLDLRNGDDRDFDAIVALSGNASIVVKIGDGTTTKAVTVAVQ